MSESLFNKIAGLKVCNFIRKRLHHSCFLVVNIVKFLRTAFFIEHPAGGCFWKWVAELLLKVFLFKWMFMSFSNFLLWEVYPSIVIHGQCIFITFDSARRERNLSKLIKQKFISATWPQQLTLKNKVIHQQISTYPKWFLVTLKISSLFIMKSLLNVNLYTWSALISHAVSLRITSNRWYKYSRPFLMPKILWYAQNSQYVQNSIFPSGKHIFPNSLINS